MAVLVAMEVSPVDTERFRTAMAWMAAQPSEGLRSSRVYAAENDPKRVLVVQEWDSHDVFHATSDKYGDEFNDRAGTTGLDWVTSTWTSFD